MNVVFNEVSLPSLAQIRSGIATPIPVSRLSNHDLFPSWEFVKEWPEGEGRRLLYRCAEGGFMWVNVDCEGMAHKASLLSNDDARLILIDHLLHFSNEETSRLNAELQPGAHLEDALESALGVKRVLRSFYFREGQQPKIQGGKERLFCVLDGGLVSAQISDDDTIIRSRLIEGREAWDIIQPFVDPE